MPSTQEFRRRIKSVNNTKQITKAMEMIASIKMQKAVRTIGQARAYIQNAWNILALLANKTLPEDHPLINPKHVGRTAIILVTSDRGLCGSYNAEIIKKFVSVIPAPDQVEGKTPAGIQKNKELDPRVKPEDDTILLKGSSIDVIAIGKVGAGYVRKYQAGNLIAEFPSFENNVTVENIHPISKLAIGDYLAGNYDKVVLIYSHFVSSLKQIPVVQQILPVTDKNISAKDLWVAEESNTELEYKFEPNPQAVVEALLKQILGTQIFGAVLEGNASEHSARMVAMKGATDNAKNLIDELTLIYNSVRQDSITREIAEISGAAESMK
ncbi:MAG: FoF1 ATP synthase subunit gamma [Patescibacteria group bacterium]